MATGRFEIEDIIPGSYKVTVTGKGRCWDEESFAIDIASPKNAEGTAQASIQRNGYAEEELVIRQAGYELSFESEQPVEATLKQQRV